MSLVYLAKRKSGKWTFVPKGQATMPPFEVIDGPYDFRVAKLAIAERNARWQGSRKRKQKENKFDLWAN